MDFSLTPDQELLRDTGRKLLERECPPALVRARPSPAVPSRTQQEHSPVKASRTRQEHSPVKASRTRQEHSPAMATRTRPECFATEEESVL